MKNILLSLWTHVVAIGVIAILLAACGDETTINQMGMEVVSSMNDLPKCTSSNEGEQAYVKGEPSARICIDGEWFALKSDDDSASTADFSCKTEELKDGSGLKIICNGDSIGVVYNGADGKQGEAGKDGEDGKDGVDGKDGFADTTVADSEKVAISLDSLVGVTQKGPFLKGSTVYLYELSDGRTLKQTSGNFTSNIARDDGRYKFLARDLVSQYAMVVVDGYYRNEVTGVSSNAPIRLKAITDMRKRNSVNVNLLTHLEFERVYHLVTRGDKDGKKLTVKQAKRQAQQEILNLFHMALGDAVDAEDMDVFGASDADAALLAISILLQGDRTESELMALLSEISTDIAEDGKWDDLQVKTELVDWAMMMDAQRMLAKFRSNVEGWNLSPAVPQFEKFIRNFWVNEKYGACKAENEGELVEVDYHQKWSTIVRCTQGEWSIRSLYDDRDGQYYQVVKIGNQAWMAENLNYAAEGSYFYADSATYCDKYGRLYNWATAVGVAADAECVDWGVSCELPDVNQGACPNGWHVATAGEWNTLIKTVAKLLGTSDQKTTPLMAKGFDCWPNATNDFSFNLLPAGRRYGDEKYTDYHYDNVLNGAYMWTGSEDSYYTDCPSHVSCPPVAYGVMGYGFNSNSNYIGYGTSTNLMDYYSVRCVQDDPAAP